MRSNWELEPIFECQSTHASQHSTEFACLISKHFDNSAVIELSATVASNRLGTGNSSVPLYEAWIVSHPTTSPGVSAPAATLPEFRRTAHGRH
jgi:hypothetical protein